MAATENKARNVFIFTWKIENYFPYQTILSPIFYVHSLDSGFYLKLSECSSTEDGNRIGFYLHQLDGESDEIDFELSSLASDGSALISKATSKSRVFENGCHGAPLYLFLQTILRLQKNEFLPQDVLTLQCKIWKSVDNLSESAQCHARTRVGIEYSTFVWRLEAFSRLSEGVTAPYAVRKTSQGDPLFSMSFHLVKTSCSGKPRYELEFSSANAISVSRGFFNFQLSFISILGKENLELYRERLEFNGSRRFVIYLTKNVLNENNGFLVDDTLSLKFEFAFYHGIISGEIERSVYGETKEIRDSSTVVLQRNNKSNLITSLTDIQQFLLYSELFSDVNLRSEEAYFPVHKNVISAKSSVLQAKIKDNPTEDIIDMPDVTPKTLRQLIVYMYTENFRYISLEDTFELYLAARKYEIFALKNELLRILIQTLNKPNACRILLFTEKHSIEDLKAGIKDFIFKHEKEISSGVSSLDIEGIYELYVAAKKQGFLTVKKECSSELAKRITTHNACQMLEFAYEHSDTSLKVKIVRFLNENINVTSSNAWKGLKKRKPNLADEVNNLLSPKKKKRT